MAHASLIGNNADNRWASTFQYFHLENTIKNLHINKKVHKTLKTLPIYLSTHLEEFHQ